MKKLLLTLSLLFLFPNFIGSQSIRTSLVKDTGKQVYRMDLGASADEVKIGDEKSASFVPKITFSKWQGENSLTIDASSLGISATPTLSAGQVSISNSKIGFYFNPDPNDSNNFKFGLILNDLSTSEVVTRTDGLQYYHWRFQLGGDWQNMDFRKIPAINSKGNVVPPEIVGRIYVTHKTKRDNQYATGQVGYFDNIVFIDNVGSKQQAILEITNGFYDIYLLKSWADSGKLPLKANDTFGATGVPTEEDSTIMSINDNFATIFSIPQAGTITKISIYCVADTGTVHVKGCVWANNGSGGGPGTLQGASASVAVTTKGWYDCAVSIPVTAGLWALGGIVDSTSWRGYDQANTGTTQYYYGANSFTTPTNFAISGIQANQEWNVYATYTAGGGGGGEGNVNVYLNNARINNARFGG